MGGLLHLVQQVGSLIYNLYTKPKTIIRENGDGR